MESRPEKGIKAVSRNSSCELEIIGRRVLEDRTWSSKGDNVVFYVEKVYDGNGFRCAGEEGYE